ncbi:MAG: GTPase Era [Spirochaetaceae bacterium]|jgi:GTP-binding protein Era|nr:GTPase Era [Spirochaetaceae bacterium]
METQKIQCGQNHKSAFVAIAGRPSAGKSTLLNTFCGAKVSITSAIPQTTRNNIRGIVTRDDAQIVFIDTPGLHISDKKLNLKLRNTAARSLSSCEFVLYVMDLCRTPGPEEEAACALLTPNYADKLFIALNKNDLKTANPAVFNEFIEAKFPALAKERVFEISALSKSSCVALLEALFLAAPCGPRYYDAACYTDQEVPFRIAEIIREQCVLYLHEELPHCVFVDIPNIELHGASLSVDAVIYCERESQKGMIVGAKGSMIAKIRIGTLKSFREIFDWKINLSLRVKTAPGWRQNDEWLRRLN